MPALYVNLMPKYQDLGYQRSSRPEQPDQRRPNKAARFPHRTEALRDSASAVSPIRFTTGTTKNDSDTDSSIVLAVLRLTTSSSLTGSSIVPARSAASLARRPCRYATRIIVASR